MVFESFSNSLIAPLIGGVTQQVVPENSGSTLDDDRNFLKYGIPSYLTGRIKSLEDLINFAGQTAQAPITLAGGELRDLPLIGEKITNPEGVFDLGSQLGEGRKALARATDNRLFLEDLGQLYDEPSDLWNPNTLAASAGYGLGGLKYGSKLGINQAYEQGAKVAQHLLPVGGRLGSVLSNAAAGSILAVPSIYTQTKDAGKTLQGAGAAGLLAGGLSGLFHDPKAQMKAKSIELEKQISEAKASQLQAKTKQALEANSQKEILDGLYEDHAIAQQVFPEVFEGGGSSNFKTDFDRRLQKLLVEPAQELSENVKNAPNQIADKAKEAWKYLGDNLDYGVELGNEMIRRESPILAKMIDHANTIKPLMFADYMKPAREAYAYISKNLLNTEKQKINLNLVNGKFDDVYNSLGSNNPITKGVQQGIKNLRELGDKERSLGVIEGDIENYFPIEWKKSAYNDPAWIEHYGIDLKKIKANKPNAVYTESEKIIYKNLAAAKAQAEEAGSKLTPSERDHIIAETLDRERLLFKVDKSRATKEIPASLAKHLVDPLTALENRIHRGVDKVIDEQMIMDLRPQFNMGPDIGKKMNQLYGGKIANANKLPPEELQRQIALKAAAREKINQEVYNDLARSGRLSEIKSENATRVQQSQQAAEQAKQFEGQLNALKADADSVVNDFDTEINKHNEQIANLLEQKKLAPTEELKAQLAELRKNKKDIQATKKSYLASIADEEIGLREKLAQSQQSAPKLSSVNEDIQKEVKRESLKRIRAQAYQEYMKGKGMVQDQEGAWKRIDDIGLANFDNTKYVEAARTLNQMEGGGKNEITLARYLKNNTVGKTDPRTLIERWLSNTYLSSVGTAIKNVAELPNILDQNHGFRTLIPAVMKYMKGAGIKLEDVGLGQREGVNKSFMTIPFRKTADFSRLVNVNTAFEDVQQEARKFLLGNDKKAVAKFAKQWEPYFTRDVKVKGQWTKQNLFTQFVDDAANGRMTQLTKEATLAKVFRIEPRNIDRTLLMQEHGDNILVRGLNFLNQYTVKQAGELRKDLRDIQKAKDLSKKDKALDMGLVTARRVGTIGIGLGVVTALWNKGLDVVTGQPDDHSFNEDVFDNMVGGATTLGPGFGIYGSAYDVRGFTNPKKLIPNNSQGLGSYLGEQLFPADSLTGDIHADWNDFNKMNELGVFDLAALRTPYYAIPFFKPVAQRIFQKPAQESFKASKKEATKIKRAETRAANKESSDSLIDRYATDTASDPLIDKYATDTASDPLIDKYL